MYDDLPMERKFYMNVDHKPALFYVVFGVSADDLVVYGEKYHINEKPKGIEIFVLNREHYSEYMDTFFSEELGAVMEDNNPELYYKCKAAKNCVVIAGKVKNDETFDYMKNVIGIIEALCDKGAYGIMDIHAWLIMNPKEWHDKYFEKEIDPLDHIDISFGVSGGESWVKTRGMVKFGRPDIQMEHIALSKTNDYTEIINRMIYCSGHGAFYEGKAKVDISNGKSYMVQLELVDEYGDMFDEELMDDMFLNQYYNVTVLENEE